MLPKYSAAWYTRLRAVLPQSGADGRAKLRTFSLLPAEALRLRCAMSFETFAGITTGDMMNSYGKGTVKGNVERPLDGPERSPRATAGSITNRAGKRGSHRNKP